MLRENLQNRNGFSREKNFLNTFYTRLNFHNFPEENVKNVALTFSPAADDKRSSSETSSRLSKAEASRFKMNLHGGYS